MNMATKMITFALLGTFGFTQSLNADPVTEKKITYYIHLQQALPIFLNDMDVKEVGAEDEDEETTLDIEMEQAGIQNKEDPFFALYQKAYGLLLSPFSRKMNADPTLRSYKKKFVPALDSINRTLAEMQKIMKLLNAYDEEDINTMITLEAFLRLLTELKTLQF